MKSSKFRAAHPLLLRFTLLLLPLLAMVAGFGWHMKRALPAPGTTLLTQGVSEAVALRRDEHGVVYIQARHETDAHFAVGFAHAQDRLWQLELQRRMVRGRLSEVLGRESVDADVWFRTLGLHESARSAWPALSADAQASLKAYAAGVNAAMAATSPLPPEFLLLDIQPEPWTEIDSLAWIKMFALNLSGNFRREIDRHLALGTLGARQAAVFFPGYPHEEPAVATVSANDGPALLALSQALDGVERALRISAPGTGSNAWVVSGRHTADGGALLANDPHLSLQIPSLWYVVSLATPSRTVAGMSLVGLPLVIFGHNDRIAWGGTNMMADTQDLFLERTDATGERYEAAHGWSSFRTRTEEIPVRADFPRQWRQPYEPVRLKVRSSEHGPIISDFFKVFDAPVALRWTALDPGDTSYEAFYRLQRARDWGEFKLAMGQHVAPALNMLFADREGNIGYLGAGRMPVRGRGQGTLPVPGWQSEYGWAGVVPPDQWPQVYNPPSGYLVSANQRPTEGSHAHFIGYDWASPARADRIEQLLRGPLEAGKKLQPEDMERIQADTLDLDAAAMMQTLGRMLPALPEGARATQWLRDWKGDMRADSQGAAIFNAWMRQLRKELFAKTLAVAWNKPQAAQLLKRLGDGARLGGIADILERDDEGWCGPRPQAGQAACAGVLASSQARALRELHKLKGDWSMDSWKWGELQSTVYRHTPLSRVEPLDRLFERRIGNGGSENAVNVAAFEFSPAAGFEQTFGAGFRQVISMAPQRIGHRFMNSTGQSGNPVSRHYDDMIQPFREVRYLQLLDEPNPGRAAQRAGSGAAGP